MTMYTALDKASSSCAAVDPYTDTTTYRSLPRRFETYTGTTPPDTLLDKLHAWVESPAGHGPVSREEHELVLAYERWKKA